ncbi:MAG: ABC transporter permease [Planctomycetota bacterium]
MDAAPPTPARALAPAVRSIWQRELLRFVRQRSRLVGAFATPVIFWVLLGFGANRVFDAGSSSGDMGYLVYFFPGALIMILLFTAIFSTISIIEDRREGFLQGVLVSPAPRLAIVLGKVLGGATLACVQGLIFLLLYPIVMGGWPGTAAMLGAVLAMVVIAVALTAVGFCMAWPMDSTAGYHALMNVLLMPMWFLSGAVFPATTAPLWMKPVIYLNPLTYGHQVMIGLLHGNDAAGLLLPLPISAVTLLFFTSAMVAAAAKFTSREA